MGAYLGVCSTSVDVYHSLGGAGKSWVELGSVREVLQEVGNVSCFLNQNCCGRRKYFSFSSPSEGNKYVTYDPEYHGTDGRALPDLLAIVLTLSLRTDRG